MRLVHRPLDRPFPNRRRQGTPFTAGWRDTLTLLEREINHLAPGVPEVVLMVDVEERHLRLDGSVRADARPNSPAVVIAFESKQHGPMRWESDEYADVYTRGYLLGWQSNVRAVALTMQALRAVDRWGVARSGQQYAGWKQLGAGGPISLGAAMTVDEAARLLADAAGGMYAWESLVPGVHPLGRDRIADAYRRAAKAFHPDAGGDEETFKRLTEARDLLLRHAAP